LFVTASKTAGGQTTTSGSLACIVISDAGISSSRALLQLPLEGKLSPKVTDEVVQFLAGAASKEDVASNRDAVATAPVFPASFVV